MILIKSQTSGGRKFLSMISLITGVLRPLLFSLITASLQAGVAFGCMAESINRHFELVKEIFSKLTVSPGGQGGLRGRGRPAFYNSL